MGPCRFIGNSPGKDLRQKANFRSHTMRPSAKPADMMRASGRYKLAASHYLYTV